MDELDPFERRLAASLRADADAGLRASDPVAVARAILGASRPPARGMRLRFAVAAMIVALAVVSVFAVTRPSAPTTGGPVRPSAAPTFAPSSSATASALPLPVGGGCGSTQVFAGPGPDPIRGLSENPWAAAAPASAGIVAYFWYPPPDILFATDPAGNTPKVLWVSHGATGEFTVNAHPLGVGAPVVRFAVGAATSPTGNYPSSVGLPSPGCWHLDLAIGTTRATMDLLVSARRPPVTACSDGVWPTTAITCEAAFRIGDQAGARVDQARIWLTTLGAVKAAVHPRQQVIEPADGAAVWAIVYDGFWRCCANAAVAPAVDQTRWLVVAEASRIGTGFVYLQDWSDKPVPYLLAPPGP